ncbi:MAG: YbhB/YbcL family Raf kinase inhibitor-like protein [Candidatus Eremiobacteraeota bacterium]|nr:YbhB/YbcL family Raf kinase inhibitor-like protein [Candidatus Eremiobacteraeota bacterium]
MMRAVTLAAAALLVAAMPAMQIRSASFSAGGRIGLPFMARECAGQNRSPALSWSAPPQAAKSLALIMHDPDAPMAGGFYHWVVYNLPASSRTVALGVRLRSNQLGLTSTGKPGYHGPCPPPGPAHHYNFTIYALDVASVARESPLTGPQLERLLAGHTLARGSLQGIASR